MMLTHSVQIMIASILKVFHAIHNNMLSVQFFTDSLAPGRA